MDRLQDTVLSLVSSIPCLSSSTTSQLCSFFSDGGEGHSISSEVKLNGRSIQIVKLLGEGGFSFVYLARDRSSGREFALKKVSLSAACVTSQSRQLFLTLPLARSAARTGPSHSKQQ